MLDISTTACIGFWHLPFLVKEFHFLTLSCLYQAPFSRIFMLSLAQPHHYYQNLLSQGVGMGMGIMFIPALTITSHYFHEKRSMTMGIVISGEKKNGNHFRIVTDRFIGSSLGGVIYPVLLNNIFQRTSGFKWGVR